MKSFQVQYSIAVVLSLSWTISSTYMAVKKSPSPHKTNHIKDGSTKRYAVPFKSDWDISRFLKLYGMELMLWRCKNAIQPYWNWQPLPYVELYCEVIGRMKSVAWYHNGEKVEFSYTPDSKYGNVVMPHFANNRYYSRWIDFKLRIYDATNQDSGMYTFQVTSPKGITQQQYIYVDISEKKRKRGRQRTVARGPSVYHTEKDRGVVVEGGNVKDLSREEKDAEEVAKRKAAQKSGGKQMLIE